MLRLYAIIAAILGPMLASPVPAAESQRVRYDVSLYGLPIGRADFESRFDGNGFAIAGRFASAGLARIFERTDGTVSANGWLGKGESLPNFYSLSYRSGEEKKTTTVRFAQGAVAETSNQPETNKKRGEDWVPVAREHLTGVADPISAMLLPAGSEAEVCRRTIKVFDGEMRVNLVLEPVSKDSGLSRAAVTCRARFVPVSGYRRGRSSIAYLRDRSRILLGFQPVDGRGVYSLAEATIATKIGTVHIRARPL